MMKKITAYMINKQIGEIREDEYEDKNGLPICKKCNNPRYFKSEDGEFLTRCLCKCQSEALKQKKETENKLYIINSLKKYAITNARYENSKFETTEIIDNESFKNCYYRCKSYCENADRIVNTNMGLYICGNVGCGKTHLMYCMVNALTDKLYSCLVTNFINITNNIKINFNNKNALRDYLGKLYEVDFLFIDDLGVEKVTDTDGNTNWVQEKMFEIIDERYNNNKPIIYTSNYKISELLGIGLHERIASRINETSAAIFHIDCESYRIKLKRNREIPF